MEGDSVTMVVNLEKFLKKQREIIDAAKWEEGKRIGTDPGKEFILTYIEKYGKKLRKDYALSDLREAIKELKDVKSIMKSYLDRVLSLTDVINTCEEKILEGIELLESEKEENGKNGK